MGQYYKVKKKETYIQSSNGKDKLHVTVWEPQGEIKAVLQISHGMIEMMERYDGFAYYMAQRGILVAGNDHLGHGKTAENKDELGYMNAYDGSRTLVCDLHRVTVCLKRAYKKLPFFLLGFSMGSFLARRYMSEYGYDKKYPSPYTKGSSIDGFICMGSGSMPGMLLEIAKLITLIEKKNHGERYRSKLITNIGFGTYLLGIPKKTIVDGEVRYRTDKDWISRDTHVVDECNANPYSSFTFTVKGFETLLNTFSYIQDKQNIARIPKNVPVLFASGEMDPVGHYSKDIRKLFKQYAKYVSNDVSCFIYDNARHEIHHELEYKKTLADIYEWIDETIDMMKYSS